jgi:hypothetical protein
MHLRRLPDNSRCWCVGNLRSLAKQWIEQVADVELSKPIDLEMAVDSIMRLGVLVYVDAGA